MCEDFTVRRAQPADAAALHSLRTRSIMELAPRGMPLEVARRWAERGSLESMLRRLDQTEVWIGEMGGHIAAWVGVRDGDYLDALYVDPGHAGRGVGSRLLRLVEDMLHDRGVRVIRATASWNAEEFYRRRGYEPAGPPDDTRPMQKRLST